MTFVQSTTCFIVLLSSLDLIAEDERKPESVHLAFTVLDTDNLNEDSLKKSLRARYIPRPPRGVIISSINQFCSAKDSGLMFGDVIFMINKTKIKGLEEYTPEKKQFVIGKEIIFKVKRPTLSSKSKRKFKWKTVNVKFTPETYLKFAKRQIKTKRDDIEKYDVYLHRGVENSGTKINLIYYIQDGKKELKLSCVYYGENWVFIRKLNVVTDKKKYIFNIPHNKVLRKTTNNGNVLEIFGVYIGKENKQFLTDLINSKDLKIRYQGEKASHDFTVGVDHLNKLRDVKTVYDSIDLKEPE